MPVKFPEDFIWGAAASSYQIEGAFDVDGRGVSIWDTFSKTDGKVKNGDNGDVACDHYNRFPEDIAIMKSMGIKAYRFSIAWPRLFPNGDTTREERGFNFYNKLINALIAADIEPMVTLYHWDLPQTLEDEGGWSNRKTVDAFAHYAKAAAEAFGDRVNSWITLNEPWCVTWLGYSIGVHAPGKKDYAMAVASAHHTALAHAAGTRAIKSVCPNAEVGLTVNMTNYINESPDDSSVAEAANLLDENLNRWWIDAFQTGKYPSKLITAYGKLATDVILPGDETLLKCQPDFLGVNYYSDSFIASAREEDKPFSEGAYLPLPNRANTSIPERFKGSLTDIGWPVTPDGLRVLLERIHRDWPSIKAIFITENGCAINDAPDGHGVVNDSRRVSYLRDHLTAVGQAVAAGVPVKGYFGWSILDNFEWAEGYSQRFGMVYVDFVTQERIVKASGHEFSKIITSGAVS